MSVEPVNTGPKRRLAQCCDTFQYVPITDSLLALLQNEEIYDEIRNISI